MALEAVLAAQMALSCEMFPKCVCWGHVAKGTKLSAFGDSLEDNVGMASDQSPMRLQSQDEMMQTVTSWHH
jgi:hypothetical protein